MRLLVFVAVYLACCVGVRAQDNPRNIESGPDHVKVITLEQNWSDEESNWFYNVPQGSRLLPYNWILELEQPNSTDKFIAADHIRSLGYIPREPAAGNEDGLPIGFVKDALFEDGSAGFGITCAACHTGVVRHNDIDYLVDGAPTQGDFEHFLKRLTKSLEETESSDEKFSRFANAVLTSEASENERKDLRTSLRIAAEQRAAYNKRNLPSKVSHRFGPGRVDAFGAIFNEVTVKFLGEPSNVAAASAPVSYPCLWDAPQHDRVQWNGAAENRESEVAEALFGTEKIGALGRNTGEVLGVFGNVEINDHELLLPRGYNSTVNKENLKKIEDSLEKLWSPQWPFKDQPIDEARKTRGLKIYTSNCAACHAPIVRDDSNRKVEAVFSLEGTDPMMLKNFVRTAMTGKLKNRLKSIKKRERFQESDQAAVILKHVVERVMLNSLSILEFKKELKRALKSAGGESFGPGYKGVAVIQVGDTEIQTAVETIVTDGEFLRLKTGETELRELAGKLRKHLDPKSAVEASDSLESVVEKLGKRLKLNLSEEQTPEAELLEARALFAYKARPLNGVWATAPYLHNGSVRTLAELLKAPNDREKKFHVGSQVFDPINVGFVSDPSFPIFDTKIIGNLSSSFALFWRY